jgi:protoporphyrinogen/coproporphyrinogen III oxidase
MSSGGVIGVVGAGPSGLAAAWRLASHGRRVRVYEAREVGGRLRTERLGGVGADVAVQLLSSTYTELVALAQAAGAAHLLVRVPGRDALWRAGRAHPLRYGSVTSMAASGALPTLLKVRMGLKYVPFLERHAEVLDLNAPVLACAAGLDRETIGEWGGRELGEDFVELMAYPLLSAYYGVTPEETGAGVFHALARAGLRVRLLGIRGGVGALSDAIAGWLERGGVEIRRGVTVEEVVVEAAGAEVRFAGGSEAHDGVIVAVPPQAAARLVPAAPWLGEISTRATATLVLATDGLLGTGWFGLSIPRREPPGRMVAAICVQEEKGVEGVGPGLVVVPAPEVGARWAEASPGEALEAALPVLDEVLPGIRSRVREARLVRLVGTTFVPRPGHFGWVEERVAGALPPRLALAGDYLVAPTVEGAVRSGLRAAERVMAWGR